MNLYDVLSTSYENPQKQRQHMQKFGFIRDDKLSNDNEQIYFNPNDKKLIMNISGTHNYKDIITDLKLATGIGFKESKRFKEAKQKLEEARKIYNRNAIITGHSLGNSIANDIANRKNDTVYGLNGGYTFFEKHIHRNVNNYRNRGDIVSILGSQNREMKTIGPLINVFNPLEAHKIKRENLKNIIIK